MKKALVLFLALSLTSINCISQNHMDVSINYALIKTQLLRPSRVDGGASYMNKNDYELGFRFRRKLSNRMSIETGLDFLSSKVEISFLDHTGKLIKLEENHELFTIPLLLYYSIKQNYFVNSGVLINRHNRNNSFDKQSGVGLSFGFGRKFFLSDIYFVLNPRLDINTLISITKKKNHVRLFEPGLQLGFGYEF